MSEKPTKWSHLFSTKTSDHYGNGIEGAHNTVVFTGPNREANARKFLHMDKLTKVARDAARLLRIYSKETKTGNGDYTADEIDSLLSKIEGKQ